MLEKILTVSELIRRLQQIEAQGHGELPVVTEGCDCIGDAGSVEVDAARCCINRTQDVPTAEESRAAEEARLLEENRRRVEAQAMWDLLKKGPIEKPADIVGDGNTDPLEF